MKGVAFFDLDGTLTERDTLSDFIKFATGTWNYYFGLLLLSPLLVAYVFKLIPNFTAKQRLISYYFRGWDIKQFNEHSERYATERLPAIIRPLAQETLVWHRQQQHEIVIVSAAIENWIRPWTDKMAFGLLATKLLVVNEKLVGNFDGRNCYGKEKVRRILDHYDLTQYDKIYAYGDSRGDFPMLSLAHKASYKPFRKNSLKG